MKAKIKVPFILFGVYYYEGQETDYVEGMPEEFIERIKKAKKKG